MAFDEILAERLRQVLGDRPNLDEKKMFGGIGFLLSGNMVCGVHKEWLIVRLHPDRYDQALASPCARPFDITGRSMRGWVMVEPAGLSDADLVSWVDQALEFNRTLPPK